MKKFLLSSALLFVTVSVFSQETIKSQDKYTSHNKGKFFVSWGGNRDSYSKSDITFKGTDYNFTIYDVTAHDKPKGWHVDYINPGRMTIPQTNFRMGYFVNDHYSVAIGVDHMKYVMNQDIIVRYTGNYPNRYSYAEGFGDHLVRLTESFLTFEHTDGLNYVNTEVSRHDDISKIFNIKDTDKIQVNLTEGIGAGFLFPKTNAKVFNKERHDDFHVAGYGASVKAGLNVTFFKHFYIQTEVKGGYINMPDIQTTFSDTDSASQEFFFFQKIIAVGGIFRI
ncbi:membrane protein [Flavobacterium ammoniigenes]|uniref:Membrane protein n=1 Tax=Flavobacterium ammoniigenes TaxID=1751095 RepID=A0ABM7V660_9FLAO|nr:hypothetical protein [Flavobacterium ammoniigenes]BDB55035.1 membrane protein [Flavobacterium ammoniigenes]